MLAHIAPSGPNRRRPRKLAALPKFGRHTRAFADARKAPAKVHAPSPDSTDPPKAGKHRARQARCWRSPRPAQRQRERKSVVLGKRRQVREHSEGRQVIHKKNKKKHRKKN